MAGKAELPPPVSMTITRDGLIGQPGREFQSSKEIIKKQIIDGNFALSLKVPYNRGLLGGALPVAYHELNHVGLALSQNEPFSIVSVKPEGDSLGRTIFPYTMSDSTRALIAAGGIVDGHGYGSDKMQMFFSLLKPNPDGLYSNEEIDRAWDSVAAVTSRAANILGSKNEVDHAEAEILAYLGEADMQTYFEIKERAFFEQQVRSVGLENLLSEVTSGIVREENHFIRPDAYIATSVYGPGVKVIEVYKNGKLSEWICSCCHNHDGNHSPMCLINNQRWKERYKKQFNKPFDTKNPFEEPVDLDNENKEPAVQKPTSEIGLKTSDTIFPLK